MDKPPIGVIPQKLHDEKRFSEVRDGILSYVEKNYSVPLQWVSEYNELLNKIKSHEKNNLKLDYTIEQFISGSGKG